MATAQEADEAAFRLDEFFIGRHGDSMLWLIYKPDLNWLQSAAAALTLSFASGLHARCLEMRHVVFAPARHASRRVLEQRGLNVEFAPLPFALYRVEPGLMTGSIIDFDQQVLGAANAIPEPPDATW